MADSYNRPVVETKAAKLLIPQLARVLAKKCVQEKQICSVGGGPTGAKVRSPLAWVVSVEDNEADEADRQSHRKGW